MPTLASIQASHDAARGCWGLPVTLSTLGGGGADMSADNQQVRFDASDCAQLLQSRCTFDKTQNAHPLQSGWELVGSRD